MGMILLTFSVQNLNAQPQPIVLDVEYNSLNFSNYNRSVVINNGNNGFSEGSVHRYDNLITKNGITVFGLLTIQEINNAVLLDFDDDITFGISNRFQPAIRVLSNDGGYIVYHLQFFDAVTGDDIFLNKYSITGIDVDGNHSSEREFSEHGGFSSYTVNNPNLLQISVSPLGGRTRFVGRPTILSGFGFENTCSYIVNYTRPNNSISFTLGYTGKNEEVDYSLQFGSAAGSFNNPVSTINPLLVAIDDQGVVNSNTGGTALNILSNDFFNGQVITPAQVIVALTVSATHPGIVLNTSTGVVSVDPLTPSGIYTLKYQVCMASNPSVWCDAAEVKIKVLAADLSIIITDSPDPVIAGQNVTYTLIVNNIGPTYAQNVKVTDMLSSELSLVSATPSAGTWNVNSSTWNIGNMAASTTETITIVAKVANGYTGSIQHSATVASLSTYDPAILNNNANQSTVVTGSANLSISKTGFPDPAFAGQNIDYTITVKNQGPSDAANVEVNDNIPVGLTIIDTDASTGTWVNPKWTVGTLVKGESATLTIKAAVNRSFAGKISNTSTVNSITPDPYSGNNTATQVTTINALADLSVYKTIDADPMIAGYMVTYSISLKNSGPGNAQSVELIDIVPSEFQFVQYSTDGGLNYNTWFSPYSIGTLNANDSVKILIRGSLSSNAGRVISNKVSVNSSTPDPDPSNNSYTKTVNVSAHSDISIVGSGPSSVVAGKKITYSYTINNNGPSYSEALIIADNLPAAITNAEYSLDNGSIWGVWNGQLNIPVFNSSGNINIQIRGDVLSGAMGVLVNSATVSSLAFDADVSNNKSTITTVIQGEVDLILSKRQTISPIVNNGSINYLISVSNLGPGNATNVTIYDEISEEIISGAQYFNGSDWITWADSLNIGTLENDSSISIQIRGTVTGTATDPVFNSAHVDSPENDLSPLNNSHSIQTFLGKEADLSVVKNGDDSINAGDQIQYSIVVSNNSTDTDATDVLISDPIDYSKISDPEYSTDGGTVWNNWTGNLNIGTLGFGDNFTLKVRGDVLSSTNGILVNSVDVSCSVPDPIWNNNKSSDTTTIIISADVAILNSVLTSSEKIIAGSIIEYLLAYSNNGPSDATNFSITDIVPVNMTSVEISRNGSEYTPWADSLVLGTLEAGGTGNLVIRGTIAGNVTGTISNSATVTSNGSDPVLNNNSSQTFVSLNTFADLTISMEGIENPVIAGDVANYHLLVKNNGPSTAQNIEVYYVLPLGFSDAQYSINGGSNWYNWVGTYQLSTLNSGSELLILFRSNIKNNLTNGSVISYLSSVECLTEDPVIVNNTFQASTTVQTITNLAIDMVVDNSKPSVGDQVKFTLTVINWGPSKATSVLVTDYLLSGFSILSDNGNGAFNRFTGIWKIDSLSFGHHTRLEINAIVVSSGDYINSAVVVGEDEDPDYSNNESTITLMPDIESLYSIDGFKNVDTYYNGQILATVTDADGSIVSASISTGVLPTGIQMNSISGKISVVDSTLLLAGNYTFNVTTVDVKGGSTTNPITIIINPDSESIYNVNTSRNADDYATGETLAFVNDLDGEIKTFILIYEQLPPGTALNFQTGEITVSNSLNLMAGSYPVTISTIDEVGGQTTQLLTLEFILDVESQYVVNPPKLFDNYDNGDTLAQVYDLDGSIIYAELITGVLPSGSELNIINGVIKISNSESVIAGTYRVLIGTLDETGGRTSQLVTIIIENGTGAIYTVLPPQNIDSYINGDTLAFVINSTGDVNSAILESGAIPPGTSLNPVTGEIIIENQSLLESGNFSSIILINEVSSLIVNIYINSDVESVYTIQAPKNLFNYHNGEIIATVTDGNGTITSAVIENGTLPSGLALNPVSGVVTVADASVLVAATYSFSIKTIDITGGVTIQQVSISFIAADLSITKECTPGNVVAGEKIAYTLIVTNHGPNDAIGVNVTDLLPQSLSYLSSIPSVGSWISPNWNINSLANGATATLIIEATINSTFTGTISNTASVSSLTSDPVSENNTAIKNISVNSVANLFISLSANPDPVIAGENLTFTITVVNNGPSDAENVVVTNDLPANVNFVSATDGGTLTGSQVKWNLNELQRDGIHIFSLVVNVNNSLSQGSVIRNRAAVKADNSGNLLNSNLVEILVKTSSILTIEKIASSQNVQAGENFSYTINITNSGPSKATNIIIADELPPTLTFVSASGNGIFNNGIVTWLPAELAKGASYYCTLVVAVKSNISDGTLISNIAVVNYNSANPVESEPENVLVESHAELEIVKTASKKVVVSGEDVSYTIKIRNTGSSDAKNVTVTDTLPVGLTFINASDNGLFANGIVIWEVAGLGSNSEQTFSVNVGVNQNLLGGTVIRNVAFVGSENSDRLVKSEPEDVTVDTQSELILHKDAVANVISGENITYSLQITNNGPSDAANILISDVLPEGVSFVTASDGGTNSNDTIYWKFESLVSGKSRVFSLVLKVDENNLDGTQISNIATAVCDYSEILVESNEVITSVTKLSVIATDDIGIPVIGTNGGTVVENVLANDVFRSQIVDVSLVDISFVSSSTTQISLNINNGKVTLANGTPSGTYQMIYRICLKDYPNVCDEATIDITVLASEIQANNDTGIPLTNNEGGVVVEDVTDNDLLNGDAVNMADIKLTEINQVAVPGIYLNTSNGVVSVEPGTPAGTYTISYKICELLNPTNCDEAVVTVTIILNEDCPFLIPTGFSPNDDGIHDLFMIRCIEKYPDAALEVFNRWGNLIYKKEKYGNVDQWGETDAWWGGFSNQGLNFGKEKLPPGTYFYILKLNSGSEKPVSGTIYLNR